MSFLDLRGLALVLATLCVALLAACSALPTIEPDMAHKPTAPVQLDGARGPARRPGTLKHRPTL